MTVWPSSSFQVRGNGSERDRPPRSDVPLGSSPDSRPAVLADRGWGIFICISVFKLPSTRLPLVEVNLRLNQKSNGMEFISCFSIFSKYGFPLLSHFILVPDLREIELLSMASFISLGSFERINNFLMLNFEQHSDLKWATNEWRMSRRF